MRENGTTGAKNFKVSPGLGIDYAVHYVGMNTCFKSAGNMMYWSVGLVGLKGGLFPLTVTSSIGIHE